MGQQPIRMCVFCRRKLPKVELTRFVKYDGVIVRDDTGSLPGRGAYCCKDDRCVRMAEHDEKGLLMKSFKKN